MIRECPMCGKEIFYERQEVHCPYCMWHPEWDKDYIENTRYGENDDEA